MLSTFCLRIFVSLTFIFVIISGGQAQAQIAKLYPVDEAAKDPSFFIFRAKLFEAIRVRDMKFIESILAPDILNSFGGNGGIAEFKEQWKANRPDSKLWETLMTAVALGGSFNKTRTAFTAPYIFDSFPDKVGDIDIDGYEYGVIITENVRVRQQPKQDSGIIATLSFDIVKVEDWESKVEQASKRKWITVSLKNGAKGYIAEDYIESPIGYRASFEKRNGKWVMTMMVAGD